MKPVEQIEHTIYDLTHPRRSYTFWGFLLVAAVTFGLIWLKHNGWLQAPNDFMLGDSPDGFKNYMTSAWHVMRDSNYVHYGGMAYPYGEHVLFTDNQPIISAMIKWWSGHISDVGEQTVGIMNLISALSLVLGAGIIFLLLRKLHLPVWYAGLAALAMLFMSPQYNRIDGHFGLSHTWVLPLLLLLLCRYEELHSRRYLSLQIGFLVWFAAQLHFYYFGISALFLGLYTLVQLMMDPSPRNFRVRLSHLVVMVLLPFALLNVWIHWSDFTTDRPASPWGFTTYIGYWEGVFLPYPEFPFYRFIDESIIRIRRIDFEARAYVGMAAFAFTLWLLFFRRFRLFEPEWDEAAYHRVHKRYLKGIAITAFVLLVFACGFPFAIKGMEWIAEYFGPFRQFRGLGRFTWVFYYVINMLMFYVLWNKSVRFRGIRVKQEAAVAPVQETAENEAAPPAAPAPPAFTFKYPWLRWAIALLPLVVLTYEAVVFQKSKKMVTMPNVARRDLAVARHPWLEKVDLSRFQAILPLPYYHIGSENIWMDLDGEHYRRMQATALYTGVPDMGVNMSRTSVGHMIDAVQMTQNPLEPPAILEDLPDNRPIALIINPARWEQVQQFYPHLIRDATPVLDDPDVIIKSIVPDSIRAYATRQALEISAEMDRHGTYSAGKGWKSYNPPGWFDHISYDSLTTTKHIFQGKGAYAGNMGDTTWIWNKPMPKGLHRISLWIYVKQDMGMTHEMKIFQNSLADGHEINFRHEGLRFYLKSIVDGWALFEVEFTVYEDNSTTRIFLQKRGVFEPFYLDEVQIKSLTDFLLYRRAPGWVCRNNFWYKLPER